MALDMKYFVLKPQGDSPHAKASRDAMATYSNSIRYYDPELADDLHEWVRRERDAAIGKS